MGGFYGSVQVRTGEVERVVAGAEGVAREMGVKCLVGPAIGEWVGVYPEGSGQDHRVGEALAKRLGGVVMQVMVHDDDVMAYWLWREGELVDSYWSCPGYFGEDSEEEDKMKGDARVVAAVCGVEEGKVRAVLEEEGGAFESERLGRFGKVMGMKNVVTSYEYLKEGEGEGVTGWRKFREVPGDEAEREKRAKKEEAARKKAVLKEEQRQLRARGFLLAEVEADQREFSLIGCGIDGGMLLFRSPIREAGVVEVMRYREPWRGEVLDWGIRGRWVSPTSDGGGRLIGCGNEERTIIVRAETGEVVRELPKAYLLAFSEDCSRVAGAFANGVAVWEVESGRELVRLEMERVQHIGLDAGGEVLMAATMRGGIDLFEVSSGERREEMDKREPEQPSEALTHAGMSADGKWVWGCFQSAMEVYSTDQRPTGERGATPAWRLRKTEAGDQFGAAVQVGDDLIFSARREGRAGFWSVSLTDFRMRELVRFSGGPAFKMAVSAGGDFLGCTSQRVVERGQRMPDFHHLWRTWDLRRMMAEEAR